MSSLPSLASFCARQLRNEFSLAGNNVQRLLHVSSVSLFSLPSGNLTCASLLPSPEESMRMRQRIARDFRSDTITVPTPEMLHYASQASLGDDVMGLDSTTKNLEARVSEIIGKEAACFMPSGTMSNQIAIRTHLHQPPHSVLLDSRSHVYCHEVGGLATLSGALATPVKPTNDHHLTLNDVKDHTVVSQDIHYAPTKLIVIENTLGGRIFPQDEIERIANFAQQNQIALHLDGSRIWHVASETGQSLAELCRPADTVNVCFSKGLGAPIGSMLLGSKDFISKARHFRKMFGGGLRQTGFLAAAMGYGLAMHYPLLASSHRLAKHLARGLEDLGAVLTVPTETNMVFFDMASQGISHAELASRMARLDDPIYLSDSRLVIHHQTSPQAIEELLGAIRVLLGEERRVKI